MRPFASRVSIAYREARGADFERAGEGVAGGLVAARLRGDHSRSLRRGSRLLALDGAAINSGGRTMPAAIRRASSRASPFA